MVTQHRRVLVALLLHRLIQFRLQALPLTLGLLCCLAARVGCVPSQINYVITSRFTPEQGYRIESRRGGGGCILITRADSKNQALMALINSIGPAIDEKTAKAHLYNLHYQGLMDTRSAKIMESALTGWNQHGVDEQVLDQIRARQFKQMLLAYIN